MSSLQNRRFYLVLIFLALLSFLLLNLNLNLTIPRLRNLSLPELLRLSNTTQTQHPTQVQPIQLQGDQNDLVEPTVIPSEAYSHGFTMLDELYLRNGTFYIVTSDVSSFPPRRDLIARPLPRGSINLDPTDEVRSPL